MFYYFSTKKLINVQNKLHWHYKQCSFLPNEYDVNLVNIFDRYNLDKIHLPSNRYTYGQVSVEYLWANANMLIDQSKVDSKTMKLLNYKSKCLEDSGLDINSCLQFLLELYSQWTKPEVSSTMSFTYEMTTNHLRNCSNQTQNCEQIYFFRNLT